MDGIPSAMEDAWWCMALALVAELETRGLVGEVLGHGAVRARNLAVESEARNPLLRVGLRQDVLCRRHDGDGELWWFWEWAGPTREARPELEPLCPARETDTAASRLARVLAAPVTGWPESAV